jgi:hypothetical protein
MSWPMKNSRKRQGNHDHENGQEPPIWSLEDCEHAIMRGTTLNSPPCTFSSTSYVRHLPGYVPP